MCNPVYINPLSYLVFFPRDSRSRSRSPAPAKSKRSRSRSRSPRRRSPSPRRRGSRSRSRSRSRSPRGKPSNPPPRRTSPVDVSRVDSEGTKLYVGNLDFKVCSPALCHQCKRALIRYECAFVIYCFMVMICRLFMPRLRYWSKASLYMCETTLLTFTGLRESDYCEKRVILLWRDCHWSLNVFLR